VGLTNHLVELRLPDPLLERALAVPGKEVGSKLASIGSGSMSASVTSWGLRRPRLRRPPWDTDSVSAAWPGR
jgi:hypothetical protein